MLDSAFLAELEEIRWFSRSGEPFTPELPFATKPVASWQEAMEYCSGPEWEQTTLEARNRLTEFLHQHGKARYQHWNAITQSAKRQCIEPLTREIWQPFAEENSLGPMFNPSIQWDVLAAIMEHSYRETPDRPAFFSYLLAIYKAGHFPSGWESGDYPDGRLRFF